MAKRAMGLGDADPAENAEQSPKMDASLQSVTGSLDT
jgi:hypothetical protein